MATSGDRNLAVDNSKGAARLAGWGILSTTHERVGESCQTT